MDKRIQALENQCTTSPSPIPYASGVHPQVTLASTSKTTESLNFLPKRTLCSTVPTASPGVPFFLPAAAITPQLRAQILA
ncbi:hypothetical protein ABG768_010649, partial [Culter alburnus]